MSNKNKNKNKSKNKIKNESKNTKKVTLKRRFASYLIDWYVGALCTGLPISLMSQKLTDTTLNQNIIEFEQPYGLVAGALALCFALFYFVIVPTYIYKGQTLGKRICKIKIVKDSREEITLKNMVLRQVVGIIILEGVLISASAIWHQIATIIVDVDFVTPLMYLGFAITGISIILLVFKKENKALHDYLGGTRVVMY